MNVEESALPLWERRLIRWCLRALGSPRTRAPGTVPDIRIEWDGLGTRWVGSWVGALIWKVLGGQDQIPGRWQERLDHSYQESRLRNRLRLTRLDQVIQALWQARIPCLVLGPAAWRDLAYPDPACCPLEIPELAISTRHWVAARQVLTAQGYGWAPVPRVGPDRPATYATLTPPGAPRYPVRLHWSLLPQARREPAWVNEWLWNTVRPATVHHAPTATLGAAGALVALSCQFQRPASLGALILLHQAAEILQSPALPVDWGRLVLAARELGYAGSLFRLLYYLLWDWQLACPASVLDQLWDTVRHEQYSSPHPLPDAEGVPALTARFRRRRFGL